MGIYIKLYIKNKIVVERKYVWLIPTYGHANKIGYSFYSTDFRSSMLAGREFLKMCT